VWACVRSGLRGKECITNDSVSVIASSIENAHRVCVTLVITGKFSKERKEFCVSCGQLTVHELMKDEQGAGKCARSAEEKSMWGG